MIEKFAGARGLALSEFLDLNHTSIMSLLVSFSIAKFAESSRQMLTNFAIGTLALGTLPCLARRVAPITLGLALGGL
jgi:hypothetical protein